MLLTDGNQTEGDVWRVLPRLKQANVRVYPIPAKVRDDGDAWVDGIDVPRRLRSGEPVTVTVRVFSPCAKRARVSCSRIRQDRARQPRSAARARV